MERDVTNNLIQIAHSEGLLLLGVVSPEYPQDAARLVKWLSLGLQGDMSYLERHLTLRTEPRQLLRNARSVAVFALSYRPTGRGELSVAAYATYPDYHKVFRQKLERVWHAFAGKTLNHQYRILVDTAPVLERALAHKTAHGFIGKNTCYIHPNYGSYLLLAEVLSTLELSADNRTEIVAGQRNELGGCGPCTACQVRCPTGALHTDYTIDARKCLAYWTIENRGPIPTTYWPYLAHYWFGCDICQDVCPYNRNATPGPASAEYSPQSVPDLLTTATMNEREYQLHFGGTAFTRAKRNGLRRNALIAMWVTQHPDLEKALQSARDDCGYPLAETISQIEGYSFEFRCDS